MVRESQKRARDNWNKENRKNVSIAFYPADSELLDHLNKQENKAGYIKALIKADMGK